MLNDNGRFEIIMTRKRRLRDRKMYKIKVTNTRTNAEYTHDRISEEDLKWIKASPNLEVRIVKTYNAEDARRTRSDSGSGLERVS